MGRRKKTSWTPEQHAAAADALERMQNSIVLFVRWERSAHKISSPAGRRLERLRDQIRECRADLNLQLQEEYPDLWTPELYFPPKETKK